MKRVLIVIAKLLTVLGGLAVCVLLYLYSIGYFSAQPAIGYIHSPNELPYIDLAVLKEHFAAQEIPFYQSDPDASYPDAARSLIEQGAEVLVVSQDTPEIDPEMLQLAQSNGVTLLLVGRSPETAALNSYDKAWYVGSNAALGGELLGRQLALGFRNGTIPDLNGDLLLQYVSYLSNDGPYYQELAQYAMIECEHYGVYSNLLEYAGEDGTPLEFTAEQLAGQQKPELFVCTTEEDARMLHDLAAQLGWLEGDAPARIGAIAQDKDRAQALMDEGIVMAVSYYDLETVSQLTAQFAVNALEHQFIGQDSELQPDAAGRFLVPYGLMTTLEDEPQ